MDFKRFFTKIDFLLRDRKPRLRVLLFLLFVLLSANLNSLVDLFLHPEIPYFDNEHIIVGGFTALLAAFIMGGLFLSVRRLEQSQAALQKALTAETNEKKRAEAIIAAIGDGITILDKNYRILYQNTVHKALMGNHVGKYCFSAYRSKTEICADCPVALSSKDGKVHRIERKMSDKGATRFFEITASPVIDSSGEMTTGIELIRDITQQKRVEAELIETERRFRAILDGVHLIAVMLDKKGNITFCNDFLLELTGWTRDEVMGRNWFDTFLPQDISESTRTIFTSVFLTSSVPSYHENEIINRSGNRWLIAWYNTVLKDAQGEIIGIASVGDDLTKRKRAEEEQARLQGQLRQAQKMEAVGQLAGGVAHDFNNILTAISGYGALLLMKMGEDDPLRHNVEQILSSSERAAYLTHSLLAFSRKQIINPKPMDANAVVRGVEKLLLRLIGEDIDFKAKLSPGKLMIMADSGQLEQVLMNLATNSRDAMPGGGTLLIETSPVSMDDDNYTRSHSYFIPGQYALLSVTDTGIGMDEMTRERIFDPFFTTKEVGKGTGLGLAMVYGIIKQQNGNINVYSEPGKGTTFKIYLPLIEADAEKSAPKEAAPQFKRGQATVLLAEDDAAVRRLMRTILEEFGYTVLEAVDGENAVDVFMQNKEQIGLIIMDVVMPKLNGKDAYDRIKQAKPDIKALFTSGYTADIVHKKGILEEGLNFISKPVSPKDLLRKIEELLN